MDLTTRLHNNTAHNVAVEVVDQFNLLRGPRRLIKPGDTTDLGRRVGFSDTNPLLRLRLRVSAQTGSGLHITATIMPIDVFVNASIHLSSSTNGEMIRVNYQPDARSINRLRLIRWAKDFKACVVGAICSSKCKAASIV